MFGRRLGSKLDLLWPADSLSSRVARKNLPPDSPVMIRNDIAGGSK